MKVLARLFLLVFMGTLILTALSFQSAQAQLILVNEKFRVSKVDEKMSRLEAMPVDRTVKDITYIVIDGYTICSHKGKIVDWTTIKPETVIRVRGGLQWDMKVKAYKIYF